MLPFQSFVRLSLLEKKTRGGTPEHDEERRKGRRGVECKGWTREAQSRAAHKPTRRGQPEFGKCETQAGKGELHLTQVFSAAMTGIINEPVPCGSLLLSHQVHEKRRGQSQHPEQFETAFPLIDAQTLDGQIAFQVAERHLNAPSTSVGQDHFPGVCCRFHLLVGKPLAGLASLAPTDHQGQGPLRKVGMGHGKEEHAAFDIAVANRIGDRAGSQAPLAASDFPRRLFHAPPHPPDDSSFSTARQNGPGSLEGLPTRDCHKSRGPATWMRLLAQRWVTNRKSLPFSSFS